MTRIRCSLLGSTLILSIAGGCTTDLQSTGDDAVDAVDPVSGPSSAVARSTAATASSRLARHARHARTARVASGAFNGSVLLNELVLGGPFGTDPFWFTSADFYNSADCTDSGTVTVEIPGGECDVVAPCALDRSQPAHAGTIRIRGGAAPMDLVPGALDAYPDSGYHYYFPSPEGAGAAAAPGAFVSFAAEGSATIPPFFAHVRAPAPTQLATPAWASGVGVLDGQPGEVTRAAGLSFTWTPPTAAHQHRTHILFSVFPRDVTAPSLDCRLPVTTGAATIPAALLQRLPAGSAGYLVATEADQELELGHLPGQQEVFADFQIAGPQAELTLR